MIVNSPKERPIVLTAQEVNAVLAGDKTQHRAMVKMPYGSPEFRGCRDSNQGDAALWGWDGFEDGDVRTLSEIKCPLGNVGDRLWVQEEHRPTGWSFDDGDVRIQYKDGKDSLCEIQTWEEVELNPNDDYLIAICDELISRNVPMKESADFFDMEDKRNLPHWRNADDMPRFASRLLLEITDIRIERVKDTSHDDAVAEGVNHFDIEARLRDQALSVAQIVFSRHWDAKHQEHNTMWEDNPWVWVTEFKVIKEGYE